jgi:uncharacterized iron-regulated membrane protein
MESKMNGISATEEQLGPPLAAGVEANNKISEDASKREQREPRLYRIIWRWHFYAGIIVLPVIIIAAVTGGLYVFKEELEPIIYPRLMFVEPQTQIVSYDEQLARATAVLPQGAIVHGVSISDDPARATMIIAEIAPESYSSVFVNQHTGAVLGQLEYDRSLFGIILNLHRTLLAGTTGRIIVELATSWGIILIVTGLYLWWPHGRNRILGVWLPRLRGKSYVIWRDWHTVPGFYFSVLAFLVMGTGLFFALLFGGGYQKIANQTKSYPPSYINPPKSIKNSGTAKLKIDEIIAATRREQSEREVYIDFPHTAEGSYTVYAGSYDSPSTLTILYLDQYSGALLDSIRWGQLSPIAKVQISSYSIHIGSIFGLPTKVLAVMVCLLLIATSVTGAAMWWIRRPKGKTGFPHKSTDIRPAKWLISLICLLGTIMPAAGISLLLLFLFGLLGRLYKKL